jgi:hypothetical protein
MNGDRDFSQLAFGITSYEKDIKAFSQNYNPLLKIVPEREKPNYKNPELKAFAGPNCQLTGTWIAVG